MKRPRVTVNGRTYTVRSHKTAIPDFEALDPFQRLVWLMQNTYAQGNGIRTKHSPLRGYGGTYTVLP